MRKKKQSQIDLVKQHFKNFSGSLINALALYTQCKLSVIPLVNNTKKPAISWQRLTISPMAYEELISFVEDGYNQFGIVTGDISNLLVIDCDNEETYQLVKEILDRQGVKGYLQVKTPKGYHLWFFLIEEKEHKDDTESVARRKLRTTNFRNPDKNLFVDIKFNGGYVVAPPSKINNNIYQFINLQKDLENLRAFEPNELIRILSIIERVIKNTGDLEIIDFTENDEKQIEKLLLSEEKLKYSSVYKLNVDQILEDLTPFYWEGQRNFIIFHLSGMLIKMGVSATDILDLIEKIADYFNDEEKKSRLIVAKRSILNYFQNKDIKGISGLYEIGLEPEKIRRWFIKDTIIDFGWDKKIETILKHQFSHELVNHNDGDINIIIWKCKSHMFLVDKDGVSLVKYSSNDRVSVTPIMPIIPVEGKVYLIYEPAQTKPDQLWMWIKYITPFSETLTNELEGTLDDIVYHLKSRGEIITPKSQAKELAYSALSALAMHYARKNGIETKYPPGIFFKKGSEDEIVINHIAPKYMWKIIENDKIKKGLVLLNKISEFFRPQKFREVMFYGIASPFNYLLKQKGIYLRYLFLNGPSKTGKTTLANLLLGIFNLPPEFNKGGGAIDTVARLGETYAISTFPVIINEPMGAFRNSDVVELLKHGQNSLRSRERLNKDLKKESIPAYSYFIFTSNHLPLRDDALERRLKFINFSYEDRPLDENKALELQKLINKHLYDLKWIGNYVLLYFWDRIKDAQNEYEVIIKAKEFWNEIYEVNQVEKPLWLTLQDDFEDEIKIDINDDTQLDVLGKLKNRYLKIQKDYKIEGLNIESFRKILELDNTVTVIGDDIFITKRIITEEKLPITNLKTLSEILGGEYLGKVKFTDHVGVRKVEAFKIHISDLYEVIFGLKLVDTENQENKEFSMQKEYILNETNINNLI